MNLKSCVSITVSGKVQGVWYRASTKIKADDLGVSGYVKNLPNGDVFIVAQANQHEIDELIEWCKKGPQLAKVTNILLQKHNIQDFEGFAVKRSI